MTTTDDDDTNGGCLLLSSYSCGYRPKFGVTRLLYVARHDGDRNCLNACTVVPHSPIYAFEYALIFLELHQNQRNLCQADDQCHHNCLDGPLVLRVITHDSESACVCTKSFTSSLISSRGRRRQVMSLFDLPSI
jgi:hypothetical protein